MEVSYSCARGEWREELEDECVPFSPSPSHYCTPLSTFRSPPPVAVRTTSLRQLLALLLRH
jgi:hypothetical protein